jgi:hypothetical protein
VFVGQIAAADAELQAALASRCRPQRKDGPGGRTNDNNNKRPEGERKGARESEIEA